MRALRLDAWVVLTVLAAVTLGSSSFCREISLQEALEAAKAYSHRLQQAEADFSATAAQVSRARAIRYPSLSVSARAYYNDETPSLEVDLPGFSLSRELGSTDNYQADFRLSLPLFTGGDISSKIEEAVATEDYSRALRDGELTRLLFETRVAYFSLYRSRQQLISAQASLLRAETIRQEVAMLFEAGAADSLDVLDAAELVALAKLGEERSRGLLKTARLNLQVLTGLSDDGPLDPVDSLPYMPPHTEAEPISQIWELQAARATIGRMRAQLSQSYSSYFPDVSAYAGYSYGKPNLDFFNDTWNDFWTIGGQLTWSFNFGRETHHQVRAAEFRLRAVQRRNDNIADEVRLKTETAFEEEQIAHQNYQTSLSLYRIAADRYRLAVNKHRNGALSTNRLLEIEAALTEAESLSATALADYYIARSRFYFVSGSEELEKGW